MQNITDPEHHIINVLRVQRRANGKQWTAYCALGAILKASNETTGDQTGYYKVLPLVAKHAAAPRCRYAKEDDEANRIAEHNNDLGHQPTLKMLDSALAESISNDMMFVA